MVGWRLRVVRYYFSYILNHRPYHFKQQCYARRFCYILFAYVPVWTLNVGGRDALQIKIAALVAHPFALRYLGSILPLVYAPAGR